MSGLPLDESTIFKRMDVGDGDQFQLGVFGQDRVDLGGIVSAEHQKLGTVLSATWSSGAVVE